MDQKPKSPPENAAVVGPKILQYLDYRDYLRDYSAHQKAVDPDFSQRTFAKEAGLPASPAIAWSSDRCPPEEAPVMPSLSGWMLYSLA